MKLGARDVRAGDVNTTGSPYSFKATSATSGFYGPTGVAFGPDSLLYVNIRSFTSFGAPNNPSFGAILRFDVSTPPGVRILHARACQAPCLCRSVRNAQIGALLQHHRAVRAFLLLLQVFKDVFVSNSGAGCAQFLHRPEGLSWGQDDRLYVSGFPALNATTNASVHPSPGTSRALALMTVRGPAAGLHACVAAAPWAPTCCVPSAAAQDPTNTDKVLIFDKTGACVDYITLDTAADLVIGARECMRMHAIHCMPMAACNCMHAAGAMLSWTLCRLTLAHAQRRARCAATPSLGRARSYTRCWPATARQGPMVSCASTTSSTTSRTRTTRSSFQLTTARARSTASLRAPTLPPLPTSAARCCRRAPFWHAPSILSGNLAFYWVTHALAC